MARCKVAHPRLENNRKNEENKYNIMKNDKKLLKNNPFQNRSRRILL